jgi:hypothetical protein
MFKRYIGCGNTPNQCLIFLKINRLGYSKIINKNDITSRTSILFVDNINNCSASIMEQILIFGYLYYTKNGINFSDTEYNHYKKLIIAFGKNNLNNIFNNFCSTNSCIALLESDNQYRIIYFTK